MLNIFKNNAYHILGLNVSAEQKDILKRSREIIHRLKIGDYPGYDFDINMFEDFRTEESVKDAVQRLQIPKKQIVECFFWFQIADVIDEQVIDLLKNKGYISAIDIWQNALENDIDKPYFYKKNLAILLCLLLSIKNNKDYLTKSLKFWEELINSDKFWIIFSKSCKLHDKQIINQGIINELKNNIVNILSDIYTELYQIHNDVNYINEFQKFFTIKSEGFERDILNPFYQVINNAVEELEKVDLKNEVIFDIGRYRKIRKLIIDIRREFNKLADLGFYDDSRTKIMRDKAAYSIRNIGIELNNHFGETSRAINLTKIALEIVGTSSCESKLKVDLDALEEIKKSTDKTKENNINIEDEEGDEADFEKNEKIEKTSIDIFEPITNLINQEEYEKALEIIDSERIKYEQDLILQISYDEKKRICISKLATKIHSQAREYFNKNINSLAKNNFEKAGTLLYNNLEIFNFDKLEIDGILEKISIDSISNLFDFKQINLYRNYFIKIAEDKFGEQIEKTLLIILVDSRLMSKFIQEISELKKVHKSSIPTIIKSKSSRFKFALMGAIIIIILILNYMQQTSFKKRESLNANKISNSSNNKSSSSNYIPPPINQSSNFLESQDKYVIVGQYRLSEYYANQANLLEPDQSLKQQIQFNKSELENMGIQLKNLKAQIESTYVDNESEYSINNYNELVNKYNAKLEIYRNEKNDFDIKIDQYNSQVSKYNNYLQEHGTKVR